MLAGTAAAEIVAGYKDLGALRTRLVEDEIGIGAAFGVVAPVIEELVAEALLGDGLQEPRWDDLVGVDVLHRERDEAAGEFHSNVLTSVTTPVRALAAAVKGL